MRVLFRALAILIAASSFCSSCGRSDNKTEFIGLDENLDFGKGIYRPNPIKFLDNIPPFSWMGMPDSVKKETELEISFNEDAVRSHSSGQLALVDQNGNIINGIIIGNKSNKFLFEATLDNVVIPISFYVDPSIGDSILRGSVVVIGNELDQVNDIELSSMATTIASWTLTQEIGINWIRWAVLILIFIVILSIIALILYLLWKLGVIIYGAIESFFESLKMASLKINTKRGGKKKQKDKDKKDWNKKSTLSVRTILWIIHFTHNGSRIRYLLGMLLVPSNLKSFIRNHYSYDNYNRGKVKSATTHQKNLEKKYGIFYYKDGWPDFRRASKGSVRIDFTKLIILGDPNNRKRIQEAAAEKFIAKRKNRKIVARYFNKPLQSVTPDDVHGWKDDCLNQGKPYHCPLTPHETLDGGHVLYVPKEVHDTSWGGYYHYGGIAVVSEIIRELKS